MPDLDNVNSAFSVTVYKKLQKQINPLVDKLVQLEEDNDERKQELHEAQLKMIDSMSKILEE